MPVESRDDLVKRLAENHFAGMEVMRNFALSIIQADAERIAELERKHFDADDKRCYWQNRAETAERALAEERERHQWRTIESAPKDGTSVLGYQNAPGDFEGQQDVCWQYGPKNNPIWIGSRGLMPTHWQPLPDATAIRSGKPGEK